MKAFLDELAMKTRPRQPRAMVGVSDLGPCARR